MRFASRLQLTLVEFDLERYEPNKSQGSDVQARLNKIADTRQVKYITPATPSVTHKAKGMFPDELLAKGRNTHSFLYSDQQGLLVDPIANRIHNRWVEEDPDPQELMQTTDLSTRVMGRYGELGGTPIVSIWTFNNSQGWNAQNLTLIRPCLRALTKFVPNNAVVVTWGREGGEYPRPMLLHNLVDLAPISGWQKWQSEHSSESYIRLLQAI